MRGAMATLARTPTGHFPTAPAPVRAPGRDELFALWAAAQAEANLAYDAWRAVPGSVGYAAFLAADDRANAAHDALAASVW